MAVDKKIDHSSRSHALLSPSAAYRWMACTPSAVFTDKMPDTTTAYAEEGTRAHELAEKHIRDYLKNKKTKVKKEDEQIYSEVYPYIQYVIDLYEKLKEASADTVMFVEQKVSASRWIDQCWGTSDCVIISDDSIYVIDLKFGKGVMVDAVNNPQARIYGLGAYDFFSDLYDITTVHNIIVQPRLDHISEEVISADDLLGWAEKELVPAGKAALIGAGEFKAGDHCKFCKAAATCRYRSARFNRLHDLSLTELHLLTDEEISDALSMAEELSSWLTALKEEVTKNLMDGQKMKGWKLVRGRSLRRYSDVLAVRDKLVNAGIDENLIYKERELLTITDMTKVLGGKKKFEELLGDLIVKPEGKPTLVPESDRREAITDIAKEAFNEPIEEGE